MKRFFFIMLVTFFIPLPLFADEPDEELPKDTPARIKESTRQIIELGIENHAALKMTRTMLENRFEERQILEAHEVLMKAKRENLPEEPVMNKLYEGVSKQIRAENIVQAMEHVRSRYETASVYAQQMTRDRDQARVITRELADCMAAGMDTHDMDRIVEMLQKRTKEMKRDKAGALNKETLSTVKSMARTGAGSPNISNVVNNALKGGYDSGEMKRLGNTFMRQAGTSSSPSELAGSYSTAIKNGATADSIGRSESEGKNRDLGPPGPPPNPDGRDGARNGGSGGRR